MKPPAQSGFYPIRLEKQRPEHRMTSVGGGISFLYRPGLLRPSAVLWLAVGTPSVRPSTPESDGPCFAPKNHKPIPAPPIPIAAIKASRLRPNCRTLARLGICERTCALGYLGCGTIPSIRSVYIPTPGKTLGKNDRSMQTRLPTRQPEFPHHHRRHEVVAPTAKCPWLAHRSRMTCLELQSRLRQQPPRPRADP
jgi:hypothetical protein